ncbi:MAG TPA: hypothetical protein VJ521_11560 [Acidobacteriota bacterium]|nr:hypothetical protein [Acidobacteriota bacterium]
MEHFRKLAFVTLFAYAALTIIAGFHSHPQDKEHVGLSCKICQFSQTSLEQINSACTSPILAPIGLCQFDAIEDPSSSPVQQISSRAPPQFL